MMEALATYKSLVGTTGLSLQMEKGNLNVTLHLGKNSKLPPSHPQTKSLLERGYIELISAPPKRKSKQQEKSKGKQQQPKVEEAN